VIGNAVRALWLLACLVPLIWALATLDPSSPEVWETFVFLVACLTLLGFPMSLAVLALVVLPLGFADDALTYYSPTAAHSTLWAVVWMLVIWVSFVCCGYYQWFVVVPRELGQARRARQRS
jgi:hypothetical protein